METAKIPREFLGGVGILPPASREQAGQCCLLQIKKERVLHPFEFPISPSAFVYTQSFEPWQKFSMGNTVKEGPWQEKAEVA